MGGGEVARYLGARGSERVSKAVFISSVPPFLLKTADNPEGIDAAVFAGIEKAHHRGPLCLFHPNSYQDFLQHGCSSWANG